MGENGVSRTRKEPRRRSISEGKTPPWRKRGQVSSSRRRGERFKARLEGGAFFFCFFLCSSKGTEVSMARPAQTGWRSAFWAEGVDFSSV